MNSTESSISQFITSTENRINLTWFYPKICGIQDEKPYEEVNYFFKDIIWPPQEIQTKLLFYIHIPFCHSFCNFCACYKESSNKWKGAYIACLIY